MPTTAASNEPIRIASLASASKGVPAKARLLMNSAMVKPMPARNAVPMTCRQVDALGQRRQPGCDGGPARQADAERLADEQPGDHAERHRRGQAAQRRGVDGDARVEQREHGQDGEGDPGLDRVLEPLQGRLAASSVPPARSMVAMRSGSIASGCSSRSSTLDVGRGAADRRAGNASARCGRVPGRTAPSARRRSWRAPPTEQAAPTARTPSSR